MPRTIYIATRGSALALVQSNLIRAQCQSHFPNLSFELKIIKTTGDKLQTVPGSESNQGMGKGLFTKELEIALLNREADFAVHSLKDLPTDLPNGLHLGAVSAREDVRDVLISLHRADPPSVNGISSLRHGATVATSSTRRQAQLLALRPDLKVVPIRGNVGTRLQKLADGTRYDAIILALAGLNRLDYTIADTGFLIGPATPSNLRATLLSIDEMLPCVGQAALGIETRMNDPEIEEICAALNNAATFPCVTAERAFLAGMGGGCLSPVAALGELREGTIYLRALSFRDGGVSRAEGSATPEQAAQLGAKLAKELT